MQLVHEHGEAQWSDQIQLGDLTLKNRVCMAALTRERCDPADGVPTPLVVDYYSQRSGAGLMLTEAAAWNARGQGFLGAACLYTQQQAEGWKKVVDAVHQKGGLIFAQLIHAGRASHEKKTGGLELWAPSAIAVRGETIRDLQNCTFPVPKAMTFEDILETKIHFEESVKLAKWCGFDGVQLHGAHGYLVDSFLRSATNLRSDCYGVDKVGRCRFALELIDIATNHFSSSRVGIKISPVSRVKDMFDSNPEQTYSYLLEELSKRQVGFVEVRESTEFTTFPNLYGITQQQQMPDVCQVLRKHFKGLLIGNDSFTPVTGLQKIRKGLCDAISFGKLYISNPDLAERIVQGKEVNTKWDFSTFYGSHLGAKGYIDYPFFSQN